MDNPQSIDWLDADGYPTDDAIARLEAWGDDAAQRCDSDTLRDTTDGAIEFMCRLWWTPEMGVRHVFSDAERAVYDLKADRRYVALSTLGWSGNELLMRAFQARWWRSQCIVAHRRGGHYVVEYPIETTA